MKREIEKEELESFNKKIEDQSLLVTLTDLSNKVFADDDIENIQRKSVYDDLQLIINEIKNKKGETKLIKKKMQNVYAFLRKNRKYAPFLNLL